MVTVIFLRFHLTAGVIHNYFTNSWHNTIKENSRYIALTNQPCLHKKVSPLDLTGIADYSNNFFINININLGQTRTHQKQQMRALGLRDWQAVMGWGYRHLAAALSKTSRNLLFRYWHLLTSLTDITTHNLLSKSTPTQNKKKYTEELVKTIVRENL